MFGLGPVLTTNICLMIIPSFFFFVWFDSHVIGEKVNHQAGVLSTSREGSRKKNIPPVKKRNVFIHTRVVECVCVVNRTKYC